MESIGDIATVTVHIKKIREKIEYDTSHPQYIETIWGSRIPLQGIREVEKERGKQSGKILYKTGGSLA